MKSQLIAYVPVMHAGYEKLFRDIAQEIETAWVVGPEFIRELMPLHQEIRALTPERAKIYLKASGYFTEVKILKKDNLDQVRDKPLIVVADALTRKLSDLYFDRRRVRFDNAFLRWDEISVYSTKLPDYHKSSKDEFDRRIIWLAAVLKEKSSDWWRQIGAILVIDKEVILESFNQHTPSESAPYLDGDPRDFIKAGERTDLATAKHAERGIIYEAAKRGIKLEGSSIYLTVFPCNICAEAIAYSGIKRCYFSSGWANLNGEEVLKANGVEIILVK
jgi:dCMP deaminase